MSEYICIDEKLQAFRGKCSFRRYIPSKPAKYGIKIFALCDNLNDYKGNLEIHTGTQPDGLFKIDNGPASVVKRLIQLITKTGKNVTTDNWLTSANEARKSEIITLYNATKGVVDNTDHMTENHSAVRKSFRWPLTVFYSMLNIGGVNAQIIYQKNCSQTKTTCLDFFKIIILIIYEGAHRISLHHPIVTNRNNN